MTVIDNTIQSDGLADFSKNLSETFVKVFKKIASNVFFLKKHSTNAGNWSKRW